MAFTYNPYKESDEVKQAKALAAQKSVYNESQAVKDARSKLAAQEANKVADWTGGTYGQALNDAIDKINNREKFTYDLNGDALYQQYKNQYLHAGELAAQNAAGAAAALTGGYGNSNAVIAASQANQEYMTKLTDKIPELYSLALSKYQMEGDQLKDQYGILADRYGTEYGEYRDKVSDWNAEVARLSDAYNNERSFDYSKFSTDRDYYTGRADTAYERDYGLYSDNYNRAFSSYQQQVSEEQAAKELALKQAQLAEEQRQFDAQMAYKYSNDSNSKKLSELEAQLKAVGTYSSLFDQVDSASARTVGNRGNTGNGGFFYNGKSYKSYDAAYKAAETDIREAYDNGLIDNAQANKLLDRLEANLR